MGITFVGGVHGVGKTTACTRVASACGLKHVSASALIKAEKASAIAIAGKLVVDVANNQELLVIALAKEVALNPKQTLLLDGHFVLRDSGHVLHRLPVELFTRLGITSLICLQRAPADIASRMAARDQTSVNAVDVAEMQSAEIQHARGVASELSLPLVVLDAFDVDGMKNAVTMQANQ